MASRAVWITTLSLAAAGLTTRALAAPPPSNASLRSVVNQYCTACHNARMKSGALALDSLDPDKVSHNPAAWERVVRRLSGRYMPPVGLPRPDEDTYKAVLASLESSLDGAAAAKANPGRTDTFRRLNRTEYRNAIRDLLALDVDVSSLLPADESSHGFDNVTVGDLSPTLLERYLSAARKISRLAMGSPIRSPGGHTISLPPDLTQEEHFDELPLGTRGGAVVHYTFPRDAEYEIQLRLTRDRNERVEGLYEPHEIELTRDGERIGLFTVKPPAKGVDHHAVDTHLSLRMPVKAGPHALGAAFLKNPSTLLETERQPYQVHFNMDRHPRVQPALYSISIIGPYNSSGPGDTPSRRRILACQPSKPEETACAKQSLAILMRRAYRRPVTDEDLKVPLKFYEDARREGGFEAGMEMALSAVLVSPEFLFRVEQDPAGIAPDTAYRIGDLELASRLSFFLWSSIPDDELLDAAIAGKLHTPTVLEQQVRRLLKDRRSEVLATNFASQWLYLRNLASSNPDMRMYPDFDDNLRQAFRRETEMLFESVLREDRSVLDLLTANYTFLNERIAKHYGIPNVYGSRFRRVELGGEMNGKRGGILRQGSVLTVTSYPTRTSPVIRGKWILDNILGVPPPPPPAAVPALKESIGSGKLPPMRERLAEHRTNPACSGCHQLMDPVGFSLENYDAVGRWRTSEDATMVDASGGLPDGSKFSGVSGLLRAVENRPDAFLTTFTEKLLTYSLGRGVEYYDAPAVRKIVRDARAKDLRFSEFIVGIAASTPFQMRRSQ